MGQINLNCNSMIIHKDSEDNWRLYFVKYGLHEFIQLYSKGMEICIQRCMESKEGEKYHLPQPRHCVGYSSHVFSWNMIFLPHMKYIKHRVWWYHLYQFLLVSLTNSYLVYCTSLLHHNSKGCQVQNIHELWILVFGHVCSRIVMPMISLSRELL